MKRAGMGLVLAAMLICGACSESKPAAAPAAKPEGAAAMTDAAKAAVAATNEKTAATTTAAVAAVTTANLLCPMLGDAVTKQGGTTDFEGHKIGFCCAKCAAKFDKLDDKGKVAALAAHGTVLK